MFIELASDPGNFDLTRQYLYICRARSMEPPKEIEKEKNVNSTSVFFLPQNPQGNFTDFRALKRLLGGKDQCCVWSCIIVLSTIIHYPPTEAQICLLAFSKFKKLSMFVWQPDFPNI